MPIGGFTKMIENILKHKAIKLIKKKPLIRLSNNRVYLNKKVTKDPVFYCGQIDELLNYRYGQIPYRSLHFKFVDKKVNSFQSASVINYPSHPTLTRIAEYKKINNQRIKGITTISYEYPGNYDTNSVKWNKPYYPIHNEINNAKYQQYANELSKYDNFYLLGRLAEYKYFDMDDAIQNAMNKFKDFIKNN
jgi:UDP-galactopyranose mutase